MPFFVWGSGLGVSRPDTRLLKMKYLDIHSHIFPDKIALKAVQFLSDYYHFTWEGTGVLEDLKDSLDEAGINKTVIFSSATKPEQVTTINRYIRQLVEDDPERFIGFGTLHPDFTGYDEEIGMIRDFGLKGIKFHPDFQQFHIDDPRMMKIYAAIGDSLPILFHMGDPNTDFSTPQRLRRVIDAMPQLRVIAAHFGGYCAWDEAEKYLIGCPGVYLDVSSAIGHAPVEYLRRLAVQHGIDRVLFASDYPAVRHRRAIDDVLKLGFTPAENEQIFYRNAERLLGVTL